MDKPKKLILDYSKWRCGYVAPDTCEYALGEGAVRLLNAEGFSCCFGQFCAWIFFFIFNEKKFWLL